MSKKLLRSTGKVAWIVGTTFLILAMPLIIEMDHNQQLNEIKLQNASLLSIAPTPKRERERERERVFCFFLFQSGFSKSFRLFFRERVFNLGFVWGLI
ncbi:mitochondrial import receptor subunit tom9-2 [Quercus suber]|uniref:Mitochondrial import receptor subunit tom9-2 n=1 Tax=Quercus suber TaxID=58331 RepID=A0AAW0LR98_QUESU